MHSLYIERPPQSHPQTGMLPHCTKNRHFRAIAYPYPRAENACRQGSILRGVAVNQPGSTPRQHKRHFTRGPVMSAAFLFGQKYQAQRRSSDYAAKSEPTKRLPVPARLTALPGLARVGPHR